MPKEKENQTIGTAPRDMYVSLARKLIKTNSVFSISNENHYTDEQIAKGHPMATRHTLLLHPFLLCPDQDLQRFVYHEEVQTKKLKLEPSWSVTIHEGTPAAYALVRMFNRTLQLMARA